MGNPNESRQLRFGYAEQTAFATGEVEASAFNEMSCEPFTPDYDVNIQELPANHGSNTPTELNTHHSVVGSMPKFAINGAVDINDIDQFLYAHTQKVVELADTEFTKTYTYMSTHPDFDADEGHFLTVVRRDPVASKSIMAKGCVCPRMKIMGARDEFIKFESDWVGYGQTNDTFDPSGTWTPRDGTGLLLFNSIQTATITHGASLASPLALTMKNFEVETVWEEEKLGHDATDGFDSIGMKNFEGNFKIETLKDEVVDEALASMKAGEMVSFAVDIGTLTVTVTGKIENVEYDSEGLSGATITCKMLATYSVGAWGEPITYVVTNSIDRSFPAA